MPLQGAGSRAWQFDSGVMCSGDDYVTNAYGNALMSRAGLLGV